MAPRVRAVQPAKNNNHGKGGKKLDPHIIQQVCSLIKEGLGYDSALNYLGLEHQRFLRWVSKGEMYLRGNCQPAKHAVYGEFVMALRKATATYVLKQTRALDTKGWFRALNILERKDRKNWSRREPMGGGMDSYDPDERYL